MSAAGARKFVDSATLAQRLAKAPRISNSRGVREKYSELLQDAACADDNFELLLGQKSVRALLEGVADHSTYLWRLVRADRSRLLRLLSAPPDASLEGLLSRMHASGVAAPTDVDIMRALRQFKQELALLVALADLGGVWELNDVTRALTRFADAAVSTALTFLLTQELRTGSLILKKADDPQQGCGMVILALGKHGAGELNYSSDIDLVVFFERTTPACPENIEPARLYVRIAKALTRILQERTGDGYVHRVDLRLRPDPGSTAIAVSTEAAMDYYESVGQNWERAAMIKARPVAGDIALGNAFLAGLAPFIWRKYFDFAAIADIHAMKRQIHAVRGHADVVVAGHDVKLGRGGIREVEFFVQTQQLIFGGKRPRLRGSRTLDMLGELARDGWVGKDAVKDLSAAYTFLREVEHRLQMIADEQTQRLPGDDDHLVRFARFCGFTGLPAFSKRLVRHLKNVEQRYARLFEFAPGLDHSLGSLVFTGTGDDPETIGTLRKIGFQKPQLAAETIRGWHFGRRQAVQSPRAREVLTELVPAMLQAFAGSGEPDAALVAFDAALTRMPAAIELMSILRSNEKLRELFADILGGAPRLANQIMLRPHVLDAAIDPALVQSGRDERAYASRIDYLMAESRTTEEFLDGARDVAHEEKFLIGVRTLSQTIDPFEAGRAYSLLAESVLEAALSFTERKFQLEYGQVPAGRCVVLGMGKLGSREMTAASDLDLILIYDFDSARADSSGPHSLHAVQYYTRLTQRMISAITVATGRGTLYEVDMRLRPSGNKGPVATQFQAFIDYQRQDAETWEHMALTRARVICGDAALSRDVKRSLMEVLTKQREPTELRSDVANMRDLIAREKGDNDPWDLKLASGALIDIEFIAQYLALRHAAAFPGILDVSPEAIITNAVLFNCMAPAQGDALVSAYRLYGAVMQMMRLTVDGRFDPENAASGVLRRIAAVAEVPDFAHLERQIADTRREVRALFDRILRSD